MNAAVENVKNCQRFRNIKKDLWKRVGDDTITTSLFGSAEAPFQFDNFSHLQEQLAMYFKVQQGKLFEL